VWNLILQFARPVPGQLELIGHSPAGPALDRYRTYVITSLGLKLVYKSLFWLNVELWHQYCLATLGSGPNRLGIGR
jgi:hypothetical protein